jgi:UTP--glucose-1-phosphate uridylyltransferase
MTDDPSASAEQPSRVTKALIPVAGLGTRMRPVSFVVPKAMLPLVDAGDRIRTVLHVILAEVRAAGIERAAVITSPGHADALRAYFDAVRRSGEGDIPEHLEYVIQPSAAGFGDAVLRGASFAGDEPFLLMLGDHVHIADAGRPCCAAQVVAAFDRRQAAAMVGMQPVGTEELAKVGAGRGEPIEDRLYRCTDLVEKPDAATARARLVTPGLDADRFLAHAGIYVFTGEILRILTELSSLDRPGREEIELTDAQSLLLARYGESYFLYRIAGRAYDTGTPSGYAEAQAALRRSDGRTAAGRV